MARGGASRGNEEAVLIDGGLAAAARRRRAVALEGEGAARPRLCGWDVERRTARDRAVDKPVLRTRMHADVAYIDSD